jgi:predicted nucleic acid-binding protein
VDCVVDASVGIKVFVEEDMSDKATDLLATTDGASARQVHVPDLFYTECANVLWKYILRFGYTLEEAQSSLRSLRALPLLGTPSLSLLPKALDLAVAHGISVYDATYAALARQTGLPLITADGRLARKLAGSDVSVIALADL